MTLPSRIAAVVLLLAALGLVFVLVSNAGVSTDVFLADPTLTPMPAPNAANWGEIMEGQLIYQSNPDAPFNVSYNATTIDDFISTNGLQPLAEGTETPLLDILAQLRADLESQLASLQLATAADAFTGPVTEEMGGVPVTHLRLIVPPQTRVTGEEFTGLDLFLALIDQGDGQVMSVQYANQGTSDPLPFQDFMAWLAENAPKLAQPEPEPTPEATEEAAPAATEEAAVEPAATEEAEPAAEAEATAESVPAATEEAAVEPAATEEPADVSAAPADTTWVEQAPGQVIYARNTNVAAQISYGAMDIESFITQSQLQPIAEDSESPALDILNQVQTRLDDTISAAGLAVGDDAQTGPALETIGGVEMAFVRLKIDPQVVGQEQFPGIDVGRAIIDHGDGTITIVQYTLQGAPDETAYTDMRTWLEANAERLAALEPEAAPEAAGTEAAPQP